ncbi:hypothetical protein [Bradyrhizobium amphicarpaeae]|uniref:hypothetical protein n=1 Tax=Bradyrhizobium amphicarpaeae TaxID=1404768 RepID=UPI0011E4D091|nr:hypothetical protein [Bradyrhizobium amphicarpaeae]
MLDKPNSEPATSSGPEQTKAKQRGWWAWIVAAAVAITTFFGWVAGIDVAKLRATGDQLKSYALDFLQGDEFKLRSAKLVYREPAGDNDYRAFVDVVATNKSLGMCQADLNIGPGKKYPKSEDITEKRDTHNGFKRFSFVILRKEFPQEGKIQLRCEKATSDWADVDWPVEVKQENFPVLVAEDTSHGGPPAEAFLYCGTDVAGWAKINHPEVCKYIDVVRGASSDGGRCGHSHLVVRCSTIPLDRPAK